MEFEWMKGKGFTFAVGEIVFTLLIFIAHCYFAPEYVPFLIDVVEAWRPN